MNEKKYNYTINVFVYKLFLDCCILVYGYSYEVHFKYVLFNNTRMCVYSMLSCNLDKHFTDNIDPTGTLRN